MEVQENFSIFKRQIPSLSKEYFPGTMFRVSQLFDSLTKSGLYNLLSNQTYPVYQVWLFTKDLIKTLSLAACLGSQKEDWQTSEKHDSQTVWFGIYKLCWFNKWLPQKFMIGMRFEPRSLFTVHALCHDIPLALYFWLATGICYYDLFWN